MGNLDFWDKFRAVPDKAQKPITGGRLSGKTDINPMWRIKTLTETFGPVGVGWKYEITRQWVEPGANGEICAFCNINLFYMHDSKWSEGIPGTGGSMLAEKERAGIHTSDECFKMALTDAISVSCKALGIGADIYWDKDKGKYDKPEAVECAVCGKPVKKDIAEKSIEVNGKVYCTGTCRDKDLGGSA